MAPIDPSIETKRIRALNNPTRQLLLKLISLGKDVNKEEINSEIRIDQNALKYHIEILKGADLIHNHSFTVDGEERAVYNISERGRKSLEELGI